MTLRGILRRAAETASDDRGFTLPELLVATMLSMVVLGGAVMAFTTASRDEPRVASSADAVQQARTTMERITREIREGSTATSTGASQLSIVTYVHSTNSSGTPTCGGTTIDTTKAAIQCQVTYSCASGICTRREAKPDGSSPGPTVRVVSGLSSNNVFAYTPPTPTTPGYVSVTLAIAAQGGAPAITLNDGATFRNPTGAS